MTLFIRLLRLGRIYRPKYDIILYKNYKPLDRLGVLHPFKDLKLDSKGKVKVLKIDGDRLLYWRARGLILPEWFRILVNPLFIEQKFGGLKMHAHNVVAQHLLTSVSGLTPKRRARNTISGKAQGRALLNSDRIVSINRKRKN